METKLKSINTINFTSFIKKLLPIDKFIFMKIMPDKVISSVYLPERDAVKLVKVDTSTLFDAQIKDTIKVSFYNGVKVVDALNHFGAEANGVIKYQEYDGELMASDVVIKNDDLSVTLACTDPSLSFMEMTNEEIKKAFGYDEYMFSFDLLTGHIDKMKSLFQLDKDDALFKINNDGGKIHVVGQSYDAFLSNMKDQNNPGTTVSLYKKHINLLDKENYRVYVCLNKIVFRSLDTDTLLTVAAAMLGDD